MAEDDKYVPSSGNPQLDPTLLKERSASVLKSTSEQANPFDGRLNSRLTPEGYEIGDGGVLRNEGYEKTKGYAAKEKTKADRAHITERTWGKHNRGIGAAGAGRDTPRKKSQISESISTSYGATKFKSPTLAGAASPIAGGISPWFTRGHPNMCGPVMVNLFASSGGVYQSNSQEAINLGAAVNKIDTWGSA